VLLMPSIFPSLGCNDMHVFWRCASLLWLFDLRRSDSPDRAAAAAERADDIEATQGELLLPGDAGDHIHFGALFQQAAREITSRCTAADDKDIHFRGIHIVISKTKLNYFMTEDLQKQLFNLKMTTIIILCNSLQWWIMIKSRIVIEVILDCLRFYFFPSSAM